MQHVHQHIQTTLQDIYRKALDADATLNALQQQKQGNFQTVFSKDAGFTTEAKRFLPYVTELSEEFESLKTLTDEQAQDKLPAFIMKIEAMLRTLSRFKEAS